MARIWNILKKCNESTMGVVRGNLSEFDFPRDSVDKAL